MTTRISSKGSTISGSARLAKAVRGAAAKAVARQMTKPMGEAIDRHYRNAVYQIRTTLGYPTPFGDIRTGGAQRVNVLDGESQIVSVKTQPWKPLSRAYAMRKPPSLMFWGKTAQLYSAFRHMPAVHATTRVQSITEAARPTVHWVAKLKRLPAPMDVLISESFAQGLEGVRPYLTRGDYGYRRGLSRKGLHRGGYAEGSRPYIARVTSALGNNLLKFLRSKR